jgi:hypothetical protein
MSKDVLADIGYLYLKAAVLGKETPGINTSIQLQLSFCTTCKPVSNEPFLSLHSNSVLHVRHFHFP